MSQHSYRVPYFIAIKLQVGFCHRLSQSMPPAVSSLEWFYRTFPTSRPLVASLFFSEIRHSSAVPRAVDLTVVGLELWSYGSVDRSTARQNSGLLRPRVGCDWVDFISPWRPLPSARMSAMARALPNQAHQRHQRDMIDT
jgi:hypothetical protein